MRRRISLPEPRIGLFTPLLVLAALAGSGPVIAGAAPQAAFDWSMPPRYGLDHRSMTGAMGADGVRDYMVTFLETWQSIDPQDAGAGSPVINPSSWRVDFDASASAGDVAVYRWSVDGVEVGTTPSPLFSIDFPAEGVYEVTLAVNGAGGATTRVTRNVTVQDWLIVAVGDSYASGEGNPEPGDITWFTKLLDAYSELQQANTEFEAALAALTAARIELELTQAEVRPALDALANWDAQCPSISLACANATARLVAELARLGFSEASQLISRGYQYVRTQIENLVRGAQAAVSVAQAAFNGSQALLGAAQQEVNRLLVDGPTWQVRSDVSTDSMSHRSSLSGQALAALALEAFDPRTSVTFVHLAHSGARIVKEPGSSALVLDNGHSQLDEVRRLVGEREIDAMIVSIGGNDAGFAKIIESLVLHEGEVCDRARELAQAACERALEPSAPAAVRAFVCEQVAAALEGLCITALQNVEFLPPEDRYQLLEAGLAKLRDRRDAEGSVIEEGRFSKLASELESLFPGLPAERIYFTEYPNLVEDDSGQVCGNLGTVTEEDWRWVGETMTVEINNTIHEATETHGWNYVDGIYEGFRRHGYCADDHWVVRAAETFLIQGDRYGAAHPTVAGHLLYAQRIAANVTPALYRSSDGSQPRPPGYGPHFRRGDVNADGGINITDAIHLLGWLFLNGDKPSCVAASDANASRVIDISDASYILGFLFLGGPPPADPFAVCGPLGGDGDAALGCATTPQACRGE